MLNKDLYVISTLCIEEMRNSTTASLSICHSKQITATPTPTPSQTMMWISNLTPVLHYDSMIQ